MISEERNIPPIAPSLDNRRLMVWFLGFCLSAALLLGFRRFYQSVSFTEPLLALMTGFEEESLYALWKYKHGLPVYANVFAPPFAASYFNWLFYVFYGTIIKVVSGTFGLGDAWIPTIARLTSLVGNLLGVAVMYRTFGLCGSEGNRLAPTMRLLLAGVCFINPLTSPWALTARPDQWAMTLELLALTVFLSKALTERRPFFWTLLTGFLLFLSFSFKQSLFGTIGGLALFLLTRRRYDQCLALLVGFVPFFLSVLLLATPEMRYLLLFSQKNMALLLSVGIENITAALIKTPWLALGAALLPRALRGPFGDKGREARYVCQYTFGVGLAWMSLLICKQGAGDYYFLGLQTMALLSIVFILCETGPERKGNIPTRWIVAGLCACLTFSGVTALGLAWRNRLLYVDATRLARRLENPPIPLKKPIFVSGCSPLNLPWALNQEQGFVIACAYGFDRQSGLHFERNGLEGMVQEGYFGTIITVRNTPLWFSVKGIDGRYTRAFSDADFDYYVPSLTNKSVAP